MPQLRSPAPARWKLATSDPLLMVAQRLEELLADTTIDSYRLPALNTHYRCVELIDAIQSVSGNELRPQALPPICAELAESLRSDEVAQSLLGDLAPEMSTIEFWSTDNLADLRTKARHLRSHLDSGRYRKALVARIGELLAEGKEKERLSVLVRDLAVEWVSDRHPKGSVYYFTRRYFFDASGPPIESHESFFGFAKLFEEGEKKWDVLLRIPLDPGPIDSLWQAFGLEYLAAAPSARSTNWREREFLGKSEGFALLKSTHSATSGLAARLKAERQLDFLVGACRLFRHRFELTADSEALVYGENGYATVIDSPHSAMTKHSDCRLDELPQKLADTLTAFSQGRTEASSQNRFVKVLNLHAAAVDSDAVENQLLNLWAAIETILPMDTAQSRIGRIQEILVPVLCVCYIPKLLADVHAQLVLGAPDAYRAALAAVRSPEDSDLTAAARLFSDEQHWPRFEPVYAALSGQPLIVNRIFRVAQMLSDPKRVRSALEGHHRRVEWQVHRIYRARNFVTHSGRKLPYANALVENLHTYLHLVLDNVFSVLEQRSTVRSLDNALLELQLEYRRYRTLIGDARTRQFDWALRRLIALGPLHG